jgi:hydrogenase nickel incorporation protein HypA/HybF
MHELAVTQGVLDVVIKAAQGNGGQRITAIDLVIGELSSIVDDSVQFYFDFMSKSTLAEGATLRFRRQPATAVCLECHHTFTTRAPLAATCPQCGSVRLQVTGGREFYVESIDVAEGTDEDPGRSTDSGG